MSNEMQTLTFPVQIQMEKQDNNALTLNDIDKLIDSSRSVSSRSKSSRRTKSSSSSSAASEYEEESDIISLASHKSRKSSKDVPPRMFFPQQSHAQEVKEKQEILYQLNRLARKGVRLPSTFTMESDIHEMRAEYERLMRDYDIDRSVAFQRNMTMSVVTGVEYLNTVFNPVNAKLDGWSQSVNDDIDKYDDIFEELHHIYKGKAKIRPELRLLMSLAGSAIMFHLGNTLFKTNIPGLDQVLKQNPDIKNQLMTAAMNTMADNAGAQAGESKAAGFNAGIFKMMANFMGGGGASQSSAPPPVQQQQQAPKMRGPGNFEDLLREPVSNNIETFSAVDDDDVVSLSNFSITSKGTRILNL